MSKQRASIGLDPLTGLDWNQRYEDEHTPWDQEGVTWGLQSLMDEGRWPLEPPARIFVPGCGRGYDVVSLAQTGHRMLGVDYAPLAIEACEAMSAEAGVSDLVELVCADLFTLADLGDESFDAVFEHTCYCAIHPSQRTELLDLYDRVLRPGGLVLGLMFPVCHREGGPPYAVLPEDLREEFAARGYSAVAEFWPARSRDRRRGKEKWFWFRKEGATSRAGC